MTAIRLAAPTGDRVAPQLRYPPDFTRPGEKWFTAQLVAGAVARLAPGRRTVVQAGGCSGLWPLALAIGFARVYTFEPEPQNFACLAANVAHTPQIIAQQAALGATRGRVGLTRPRVGAGLWRVEGTGTIPRVALDDVLDEPIDAIVLDVEGSEVQALQGAARLIATHRPLLWFEFLHQRAAIVDWLAGVGYTVPRPGVGQDWYSVTEDDMAKKKGGKRGC